jgi:excisionase family DNA binding protein
MKRITTKENDYLDMDEASSYLGIKKSTLYLKVHYGEIGYIKIGSRTYFKIEELDRYLDSITKRVPAKEVK